MSSRWQVEESMIVVDMENEQYKEDGATAGVRR
jgi:hypothetical protein